MPSQTKGGKKDTRTKRTANKAVRKSSSGNANRRRSGSRGTSVEENEIPDALFTEISILFLLAFCIILILGNFGLTLRFGDILNSLLFGLFGGLEYIFPFFLFFAVCFYLINRENKGAIVKLISSAVLFFDIGMFMQLFVTDDYSLGGYSGTYDYSMSNRSGGGVISGSLFEAMKDNLGKPATIVIMVIVLLICLFILTGKSVLRLISYSGEEIADRARERRIEWEKDREVIREEKKLIKAEEREKRSLKRAELREEKRRKFREDTLNKKKNIFNITVGDDAKNDNDLPIDTSFTEIPVNEGDPEDDHIDKDDNPGYSPFAMSPEHMVKPKEYDKKIEPKPVPEIRLREPENSVAEELPEEEPAIAATDEMPEEEPAVTAETLKKEKEDDFYDRLFMSHEVEMSDMHEITFDDEGIPEDILRNGTDGSVEEFSGEAAYAEEPDTEDQDEAEHEEEESREEDPYYEEPEEDRFEEEPEDPFIEEEPEDPFIEEEPDDPFMDEEPEDPFIEEEPEDPFIKEEPDNSFTDDEPEEKKEEKPYELPPVSLLRKGSGSKRESENNLKRKAEKLQDILSSFGVKVRMLEYIEGPTVTRFEMQPEQGVKVNTILNLSNDIQMNLAAKDIRIEAPIPGKAAVGIEIPNENNTPVMFRDLIESDAFKNAKSKITVAVGKDIGGDTIVYDIDKMPHLLIAGATGSGKSVCINTIIMSILYKAKPDEVKLIMIDPKVVELNIYNGIPHLLTPVVTDPVKAAGALNWGVAEMMKRYQLFARAHVRNMEGYNEKVPELNRAGETLSDGEPYVKLPQIVIIVDELADLMMVQKKDVEASICRLAQLARAAGIHLVIATQRPSVDVITGLIKANMPSRIAFAVSSNVDSRTILDSAGAEKLLGNGDMLFYPQKYPKPERLQGAYVSDEEVQAVADFIREECASSGENREDISEEIEKNVTSPDTKSMPEAGESPDENDDGRDSYFADAGRIVTEKQKATIGFLQRVLSIGFNRAARIMDQLAEAGVVSGENGTKPRQVLMTKEEFESYLSENMTGSE